MLSSILKTSCFKIRYPLLGRHSNIYQSTFARKKLYNNRQKIYESYNPSQIYDPDPEPTTQEQHAAFNTESASINIVRTTNQARMALKILEKHADSIWACDTEVADIDLKKVGPVGNGKVICVSIYGGDNVDFGNGTNTLWVENDGIADGVLLSFKQWFENPKYKKVWHNYGFDRHVMFNEGIDCKGFAGDTMHMARLWDSSREKSVVGTGDGYSLASLSTHFYKDSARFAKISMKDIFGIAKIKKDGEFSKIKDIPDVRELQNNDETRTKWIEYSARDAVATWWVRESLVGRLRKMKWIVNGKVLGTMMDFYDTYLSEFGELLTDMERNGIKVDTEVHLKQAELAARAELQRMEDMFMQWASEYCTEAKYINTASPAQMTQFLFGEYEGGNFISHEKVFKIDKSPEELEQEKLEVLRSNPYATTTAVELKTNLKNRGLSSAGKKEEQILRLIKYDSRYSDLMKWNQTKIETMLNDLTVVNSKNKDASIEVSVDMLQLYPTKEDLVHAVLRAEYEIHNKEIATLKRLARKSSGSSSNSSANITTTTTTAELKATTTDIIQTQRCHSIQEENSAYATIDKNVSSTITTDGSSGDAQITVYPTEPPSWTIIDNNNSSSSVLTMPKKYREITIRSLGLQPVKGDFTPAGIPQVSAAVLKKLAGKNIFGEDADAQFGTAYEYFEKLHSQSKSTAKARKNEGNNNDVNENSKLVLGLEDNMDSTTVAGVVEKGKGYYGARACRAIGALAAMGQIETTINNFLVPLQALVDKQNRIHCSLNLNTETGRLSSRRPNLQNQPALEKDQYKIRDAFIAEEGKTFIVADYGQLELRVLAHISNCESMITAFKEGGCFHSRTAMGMYDYIKTAVDNGDVMLEWDYSKGQPTVPLVKDRYASERRKAKTLNFSIAYGKTVHGLANDWGITKEAAQETLDAWYRDRPEVKKWQEKTQDHAMRYGYVDTIMGRYRHLPDAKYGEKSSQSHALRAAINTPIQGSAADIVMMAMLRLWKSKILKKLDWKLLLQIHDEVILEGPKESRDEAMKEVRECMEKPFDGHGLHPLNDVDAKSADSWYKAK